MKSPNNSNYSKSATRKLIKNTEVMYDGKASIWLIAAFWDTFWLIAARLNCRILAYRRSRGKGSPHAIPTSSWYRRAIASRPNGASCPPKSVWNSQD